MTADRWASLIHEFGVLRGRWPLTIFVGLLVATAGLVVTEPLHGAELRRLGADERSACERAVQEVYARHRSQAAGRSPSPRITEELLAERILRVDKQRAALAEVWSIRLSPEIVRREVERMAAATRAPDLLRDLWAALGEDSVRIAQCLAEPALTADLVRRQFAQDAKIHAEVRRRAQAELRLFAQGDEPDGATARVRSVEWVRGATPGAEAEGRVFPIAALEWDDRLASLEQRVGSLRAGAVSDLIEEPDRFFALRLEERAADRLIVRIAEWPKRSFEDWWSEVAGNLSFEPGPRHSRFTLPKIAAGAAADPWRKLPSVPDARAGHTAVWTGSELLVWGGILNSELRGQPGGRYDPALDLWLPMSVRGVPQGRTGHTAVWTGSEMIVWGGYVSGLMPTATGGRYDPVHDEWTPTSTGAGTPDGRASHRAVWTGSEMIVWGGNPFGAPFDNGSRYDPSTDTWTPMSTIGAPSARSLHEMVWTGSELLVWGGNGAAGNLGDGARYVPASDSWTPMSTADAPPARATAEGVWTGSEMIVWGGCETSSCSGATSAGGRYDPSTDTWTPTSETGAPFPRRRHSLVWTGSEVIAWGGCTNHDCSSHTGTGGRYDPSTDTWASTDTSTDPGARTSHTATWTGSEMIVWGGCFGGECKVETATGGRYSPSTDTWASTDSFDAPSKRIQHTATWTGSEMIVWGGFDRFLSTSGRSFDLGLGRWQFIDSLSPAPIGVNGHTAVWTGSEVLIWGGLYDGGFTPRSVRRYSPATGQWMDGSNTGAPTGRSRHGAVWTGDEMVVWGGQCTGCDAGGRYDPVGDTWTAITTVDAPSARDGHLTLWTGNEMFVWGGWNGATVLGDGALYDPALDTWAPVPTAGAPTARQAAAGVWTGSEVLVWGGATSTAARGDGARFSPLSSAWTPIESFGAPPPRHLHTGVWTGSEMIVWGGCSTFDCAGYLGDGGRYDPLTDAWQATAEGGRSPRGRALHSAVWTGEEMLIWGGWFGSISSLLETGGAYTPSGSVGPGDAIFSDDFESGGFAAWSAAVAAPIDPP